MPVGGAILGAGAIAGGASIYGANKAAKASKKGMDAQILIADKNLAAQKEQLERVWKSVDPFLTKGTELFGQLADPAKAMAAFYESPDYNFRKNEAMDSLLTNKATSSLLRSGSALRGAADRISNVAANEWGSWWQRQSGLAGAGLEGARIGAGLAGSAVGALNANTSAVSGAIGSNAANQGNAAIATGNAIGGFAGDALGAILSRWGGAGGAGGGSPSSYDAAAASQVNI